MRLIILSDDDHWNDDYDWKIAGDAYKFVMRKRDIKRFKKRF